MTTREPPTVLIIEDEPGLADIYERWLADRYRLRIASDGTAALSELDTAVDVVVLDRVIPGLSGDTVLGQIEARGLDCRVAIVSAVEPDFDVIEMGFDDYLIKPVKCEELVNVIETLLLRNEYTERMQDYFSLASKRALLEASKHPSELKASKRYAQLEARITALETTIQDIQLDLLHDDTNVTVAFRDLQTRTGTT